MRLTTRTLSTKSFTTGAFTTRALAARVTTTRATNIRGIFVRTLAILAFPTMFLLASSCRKSVHPATFSSTDTSFSAVFEYYWQTMNTNYMYWDIDTTDWDGVYARYKPAFAALKSDNPNDQLTAVQYLANLTNGLIDSHYSISFGYKPASNYTVFPAYARKMKSPGYHSPYPYLKVDSSYFDRGYVSGSYYSNDSKATYYALCGTINNKILYFTCTGFALSEAWYTGGNSLKTTLAYFFNLLQSPPPNIKGIIIDVRNNHGGNVVDLSFLMGRMIAQPLHIGYTRYKSGNDRLAYTPWIDAYVTPVQGGKAVQLPVVALADNFSISLAEAVTIAVHTMPTGKFVGETTWGATGPIADTKLYNDGQFNVGNFMSIYTSSAEFRYNDHNSYEGKGFPPDVSVPFDQNALSNGHDPQLEKAISLVP